MDGAGGRKGRGDKMKRRGDLGERVARKLMGEEDLERKMARVRLECRRRERGIEKLAEQMTALKKAMEARQTRKG